jgi:hypothetical protein
MPTYFSTGPVFRVIQGIVNRLIFASGSTQGAAYRFTNGIIDAAQTRDTGSSDLGGATHGTVTYTPNLLRAGLLMGTEASSQQYRNSIIGVTHGNITGNSTTTIAANANVGAEIARLIAAGGNLSVTLLGPATAGGTIQSETAVITAGNATTGNLTLGNVTTNTYIAGSIIQPADGSQLPVTVITTPTGIDVTDMNGNSLNQAINADLGVLIGGDLLSSMIVNYTADDFGQAVDTSVQAWIRSQLPPTITYSNTTN